MLKQTTVALPQTLKDILPAGFQYTLISFSSGSSFLNEPRFSAVFRANVVSKNQSDEWLSEFMKTSLMTWRVLKTWPEDTDRIIFKKQYRCQHNTMPRAKIKETHAKHTKCPAKLMITVQRQLKLSKNPLVKIYPCLITMDNVHNHLIFDATSLGHRDPSTEVREKFIQMFNTLSPSAALHVHKQDLKLLHNERYSKIVSDRHHCPDLQWVYRLYNNTMKENYDNDHSAEELEELNHPSEESDDKDNSTEWPVEIFYSFEETYNHNNVNIGDVKFIDNIRSPDNMAPISPPCLMDYKLEVTCRACLTMNLTVSHIIEERLKNIFFLITGIKIANGNIPMFFCDQCFKKLIEFDEFRNVCLKSNNILQRKNINNEHVDTTLVKSTREDPKSIGIVDLVKHDDVDVEFPPKTFKKKAVKIRFKCQQCAKWFYTKERLDGHERLHKGKKQAVCNDCGKEFTKWSGLKQHMVQHKYPKRFMCHKCGMLFSYQWSLKMHDRVKHLNLPIEKSTCDICGKVFSCKSNLMSHIMTVHYNNRACSCTLCRKYFKSRNTLKHHYLRHKNTKRYSCSLCKKEFVTQYELKRHTSVHSEDRPFKCDLCNKMFKRKLFLMNHMKTHLDQKTHFCIVCKKSFATAHTLKEHKRTHTGEKPLSCILCKRLFAQRNVLQNHMKSCTKSNGPNIQNILAD